MSDWQLIENGGRLMFVCDDFENDAAMTLSGDFSDESSRDRFAQSLLAKLNTRATDAELERLRELLSDIKEWEIGRESREPLFVLPTELRARIQAAIDEARKG